MGKRLDLEHTHRPVPDDGLRTLEFLGQRRGRLRANIQDHVVAGHVVHLLRGRLCAFGHLTGHDHIGRLGDVDLLHERPGLVEHVVLTQ